MSSNAPKLAVGDPVPSGAFEPERLGVLGHTLTTEPAKEEVPADALLDEDRLAELVDTYDEELGGNDRAIAASSFAKRWITLAAPGVLAAWALFDVGLDASPANLAIQREDATPVRVRVVDPKRFERGRPARERAIDTLLGEHLAPFVDELAKTASVPEAMLWGSVANIAVYLFDRLEEYGFAGRTPREDRARLVENDEAAWASIPNPMAGAIGYEPMRGEGLPERYQVREVCCLKTEIAGKTACASCPRIDAAERAEKVRQRRLDG